MLGKIYARLSAPPALPGGSVGEDYRASALIAARRAVELDPSSYKSHVALALTHHAYPDRARARDRAQGDRTRPAVCRSLCGTWRDLFRDGCVAMRSRSRQCCWHLASTPGAVTRSERRPRRRRRGSRQSSEIRQTFDEAQRIADEAVRRRPARHIRRARAWILLEVGRLDEAERMLKEAARDGGIRNQDRLYLAGIELKRGRLEVAAESFRNLGLGARGHIEVARQYVEAKLPARRLSISKRAFAKSRNVPDFSSGQTPHTGR
jgi:tetratricopeptide (TPR) repeat protein